MHVFLVVVAVQFVPSFRNAPFFAQELRLLGIAFDCAAVLRGLGLLLLPSFLSILPHRSSTGETCSVFSPRRKKSTDPSHSATFSRRLSLCQHLVFSGKAQSVLLSSTIRKRTRHQIEAALAGVCKHLRSCQKPNRAFSFQFPDQNSGQALSATFYTA